MVYVGSYLIHSWVGLTLRLIKQRTDNPHGDLIDEHIAYFDQLILAQPSWNLSVASTAN